MTSGCPPSSSELFQVTCAVAGDKLRDAEGAELAAEEDEATPCVQVTSRGKVFWALQLDGVLVIREAPTVCLCLCGCALGCD